MERNELIEKMASAIWNCQARYNDIDDQALWADMGDDHDDDRKECRFYARAALSSLKSIAAEADKNRSAT